MPVSDNDLANRVIGLFNDSYPPVLDGVTLTVENYARCLTDMGYHTCVVTPWNPVTPAHPDYDLYRFFSLPIPSRKPYRYGYPKADPFIWSKLRHTPFGLIHAHCPFATGRLALYAARKHNVPLVATFHSKYRTDLEHSLPQWMVRRIMKKVMDFFNAADEVWIPQPKVEDTVREYGYKGPLTVVDNGIDLAIDNYNDMLELKCQARSRFNIPSGQMRLLFVGQHILEKGVDVILNAIYLLKDADVHIDFIGTGYAVDTMKHMIATLEIKDKVTLHGVIQDRDILKMRYAAADLFLFPSFYDNAPLVVREAAMMGTPSILPTGSTAAEVIHDGENGFLTERSAEAYARKVNDLIKDRTQLLKAGEGAFVTLTRSWKAVMDEVIQRYSEIIDRYGAGKK